ncbi:MAG TPA: hypothetical protein VGM14_11995 [Streptosporangiaceae bacterium]|jgi:hypothetical protein
MGAAAAQVTSLPPCQATQGERRPDGLVSLLAGGTVRSARDLSPGAGVVPDADLLPVLPALQDLLPLGALQRGSIVAADSWSMLCLALAAGPVASGAWCAVAGIAEFGVAAAADTGLDPARLLLVPDLGQSWPQVVMSLLDGCDLVLLRLTDRPSAQTRRKLEAAVRRHGAVLIVAGNWDGAQVRLRIASQVWTGIGLGHGRLRERKVQVVADGRGSWSRSRARWLWLPGPDGTVSSVADDLESPGSHEITAELELALTAELEAAATAINTATAQRTSAG